MINSLEKCQYDIEDSIYGKGFGKATETMLGILRAYPTANVAPIADTVRKMQERLKQAICDNTYPDFNKDGKPINVWKATTGYDVIDQIAKEMVEG